MNVNVLNLQGEITEQINIDDKVFGIKPNDKVTSLYLRVYQANQRQGTSSTKDRSEVSGGGKKPWKQKGSGKARVGSTRSPLWRHGGVTHGPKPKSWNLDLPKKIKRLATLSALSSKFINNSAIVVTDFNFNEPSTKQMVKVLKDLNVKKTLIVLNDSQQNTVKSANNLKSVKVTRFELLNAFDILNYKSIIFSKSAILSIENRYKSPSTKELSDEN